MKSEQSRMGDMRGGVKPGEDGPPSPPALDGDPRKDKDAPQRDDAAVREFFQQGLEGGQVLGERSHGPPAHRWGLDVLEDSVPTEAVAAGGMGMFYTSGEIVEMQRGDDEGLMRLFKEALTTLTAEQFLVSSSSREAPLKVVPASSLRAAYPSPACLLCRPSNWPSAGSNTRALEVF